MIAPLAVLLFLNLKSIFFKYMSASVCKFKLRVIRVKL